MQVKNPQKPEENGVEICVNFQANENRLLPEKVAALKIQKRIGGKTKNTLEKYFFSPFRQQSFFLIFIEKNYFSLDFP